MSKSRVIRLESYNIGINIIQTSRGDYTIKFAPLLCECVCIWV